jgi:hypothetical protein
MGASLISEVLREPGGGERSDAEHPKAHLKTHS